MVIPLKLFLDMIPSSAADDVAMCVAWMFRGWKYVHSRLGCPREQNRVSGLAVSQLTWNIQIREWPENNLRGITLEIRPEWGIHSLIFHFLLVVWYYTFPCSYDFSLIESVCAWRHQILKTKTKEPLKVLSSSGIRGTKFIPAYNFPAQ